MSGPPADDFSRDDSLGYQINLLARLLARALNAKTEPLGVVPGQFAQLLALFEEEGLTQSELCAVVKIEQPTMARTLQRMERAALVRREADPVDGRKTRVLLTERSRELQRPLVAAATEVNQIATRGLGDREVETLMALVRRLVQNMEMDAAGAH